MAKEKRDKGKYYSISIVSKMLGIHQQTIRIYEKEGLINPKRTRGNTRLFSDKDVDEIKMILRLTNELGVNLAGVGVILEMRRRMEEMEQEFQKKLQIIMEEIGKQFMEYMREKSCLPVLSPQGGLIIHSERDNSKRDE